MGKFVCPGCGAAFPTTGIPNHIEGKFIDDVTWAELWMEAYRQSMDRDAVESLFLDRAEHARRCPTCGRVDVLKRPDPVKFPSCGYSQMEKVNHGGDDV